MSRLVLAFIATLALSPAAFAQTADQPSTLLPSLSPPSFSPFVRDQDIDVPTVERIVRDYLKAHPEVIVDALTDFQQRKQTAERQMQQRRLSQLKSQVFDDPASPVGGNPAGDVTMVEFFDYQCGYCKSVQGDVAKLASSDPGLRIVYKEFPILGQASVTAAKAALASHAQQKYEPFHAALMEHRGQFDDAVIFRIAQSVGLDIDRLRSDMEDPSVLQAISANVALAEALGITGTPGFIVGDQIAPGAIRLDDMKQLVRRARTL